MEENTLITLNDGNKYFVLSKIYLDENNIYIFTVPIDNEYKVIKREGIFFKIIKNRYEIKLQRISHKDNILKKLAIIELLNDSVGSVPGAKKQINDFMLYMESSI